MDSGNSPSACMPKPKLLVLASTYPRWKGDYEPGFVHELSKRLTREFHVTVLCPSSYGAKSREELDSVHVVRYRYAPEQLETLISDGGLIENLKKKPWKALLLPAFLLCQIFALLRLLLILKPDVIHAHWLIPQGLCVSISQLVLSRNIPVLVTSHGADLFALRGRWFDLLKRIVLTRASRITVVSTVMKLKIEQLGISSEKVMVEPMGVSLGQDFHPGAAESRRGASILFVGRLVEKKGLEYLIYAMPTIMQHHRDAFLRIVGFGPQEQNARELVAALGLEDRVQFAGPVSNKELPEFYREAAVFVAPFVEAANGDQEGLGLVLVEAIGCGCPTVVSDIPAARDVIDGLDGVITVPQKNSDAIALAVSEILGDLTDFEEGARESGSRIKERFDWEAVAGRYEDILLELLEGDCSR
ncbi:Glycosyltransferase involved in cell wall bisynthesis [Marinobacter gudaonensis]|uniref:Glycosyltransferase involved in cell wall bisynthesis n=1 Tax=Marinobacter gudaonensis TaxID=375760 RepID=A0A1I6GJC1_9GAMM|nr:glycosyltransferase [Marinobacter gudaonensis]SFR42313.1 Glycosyltransferase involved in cell wall bisynthesis [Marinobacter gudaonensis]